MGQRNDPPEPPAELEQQQGRLAAFFRRLGSSTSDDVGDLVQDTWERYLGYRQREVVREPGALLAVIARRVWVDHVRHGVRQRHWAMTSDDDGESHPDFSGSTVARLDLVAALRQLSPEDRQLIRWRFQDGQSLDHIAGRLHITPAACRQRMVRALRRVRQLVDEHP